MIITNVCYIINEKGEYLLQKKARGFGIGKWNGPGGKLEAGETLKEGLAREIKEETTIEIGEVEEIAYLEFNFPHKSEWTFQNHVYTCKDYKGEPFDTGEGELRWFKKKDIPIEKMWDDDRYWIMDALNGEFKKMSFEFDEAGKVTKYEDL